MEPVPASRCFSAQEITELTASAAAAGDDFLVDCVRVFDAVG